jgi:O-antigen/teichoic acid export membrane protein
VERQLARRLPERPGMLTMVRVCDSMRRARRAPADMRRDVLFNALWGTLDRYSRLLLGVISTAIVARYLGPDAFGALGIATSYAALAAGMANLGLDAMAIRWMTDPERERSATLSAIISIRVAAAVFWFLVLIAYLHAAAPLSPEVQLATIVLSAAVLFNALEAVEIVFFTDGSTRIVAIVRTVVVIVGFLMKMGVVVLDLGMQGFIVAMFVEAALSAAAVFISYRKHFGSKVPLLWPGFALTANLLKNAAPFLVSNTLVILNLQAGKLVLYNTLGSREFGIYFAANRLVEVLFIIPVAFGNAFFSRMSPGLSVTASEDAKYDTLYTLMSCIAVMAITMGIILGKPVLSLLYGAGFSDAYGVFCILIFSTVFIFHVSIRTKQLINEGRQALILSLTLLTLIVNISATYAFSTVWGLRGAAIAFVLAWFCNSVAFPLVAGRSTLVFPLLASLRISRIRRLFALKPKGGEINEDR